MENFSKFLTKDRQKQRNLSDILRFILDKGNTTRRQIERETGFSWGAVSESVAELLSRGYITEMTPIEKGVGRTSTVLSASGDKIASVGLDINTTGITARVVGFDLTRLWRSTLPFTARSEEELFTDAISLCSEAIKFCEDKYKIFSIGVAIQGKVDPDNGISVHFPNLPWESINVREMFRERFGVPTTVEHDPKCLLIAKEYKESFRDAILLRIDRGIGLSVIQDGKILGDFGRMEIGHTIAVPGGALCTCGKRGCLEAYSSIVGIENRVGKSFEEILGGEDRAVFAEATSHLAVAIHNLSMLFSPEKIILSGKLSEEPLYTEPLIALLRELIPPETDIEIDNNISAAFGAALVSIRDAIKKNHI